MLLGSHLSIAGGLHKALESARAHGFNAVGLFLRNQRQWREPALTETAVEEFRRVRAQSGVQVVVAHGSYLANLAGYEPVREKSIAAIAGDLGRAARLGVEHLVLHPGWHHDEAEGIRRIADGINEAFERCGENSVRLLLETTSGSTGSIGGKFEHLAEILHLVASPRRLGVCLDTCHVFAAGYDIRTADAYERTMRQFDETIGLKNLLAVHLNDSLGGLGSRRDRHEHIGRGKIGREGFANVVRDSRLAAVPMILETPKGQDEKGRDWDDANAAVLRRLGRQGPRRKP